MANRRNAEGLARPDRKGAAAEVIRGRFFLANPRSNYIIGGSPKIGIAGVPSLAIRSSPISEEFRRSLATHEECHCEWNQSLASDLR